MTNSNRIPLLIVAICGLFWCLSGSATAQTANPQEILDNWANAIGGRDLIDSISSIETESKITLFGMEGSINQKVSTPDQVNFELDLGGIFSITNLIVGEQTWTKDQNGHVVETDGHEKASMLSLAFFENMNHLRSGASISLITKVEIEESTGYLALTVSPPNCTEITYFLDPATWLPVRSESDASAGDLMTSFYSDWQQTQGLLLAHKVHQTTSNTSNDMDLVIESVRVNPTWSTDPFKPLSEKQIASAVVDPKLAASIPMKLRGVHMYVDVMINGQGPFQFIYDTGAGMTVIDKGLAESLGLSMQGEIEGGGVGEGSVNISLAVGVDIGMQGVEVLDQTIATLNIQGTLEERIGTRVDGILGFGFISRFVTEVDYANSRIGLHDPKTFKYQGDGVVVPMSMDNSTPHIEATVTCHGGKSVTGFFLLDTGSGGTVSMAGPFAEKHGVIESMPKTVLYSGGFGAGGESTSLVGRLKSVELGGLVFNEPVITVSQDEGGVGADVSSAGLIGGRILSRCRIFLNYPGGQLILEPNDKFADSFNWNKSGLTVSTGGRGDFHHFTIVSIVDGSPAQKMGLRKGDQLLEVAGKPAAEWVSDELSELFSGKDQDLELVLQRDGKTIRVTLKLRDFI
ncbi:MAG: hypothetical protein GY752_01235 [bacterium]|nr:hypothetical protein [bacterium]